jgi:hypothetical protein
VIRGSVLALALAVAPAVAAAQVDTTRRDTTVAADTTQRDTMPVLLPNLPPAIAPGPLPRGARYTFTADSQIFSGARTLSDLLSHIPGVYVARGGWYGQAEIPLYGGRGPAALEIYWDGVPMQPLGRDSIYLDPARIPLGPIDRVDVIIRPTTLQVYLVTAQHGATTPRTQVGIVSGVQDIADYRAGYAMRSRAGFGVSLLADWSSIGPGANSSTSFGTSDLWLRAEYVPPGGRVGASFQISSSSWHRSAATLVDAWRQDRRDRVLHVFLAQRDDGLGWRLTGTLAASGVSRDPLVAPRNVSSAALELSRVWPRASIAGTARFGTAGLPQQQFEARGGWIPVTPITLAATFRQTFYPDGRSGFRTYGTAGLALPLGLSARAEGSWQKDAQSVFVSDQPQEAIDVAAWVRFDHRRLTVEFGRGRRDPFAPLGFPKGIKTVDSLNPTPRTDFVAAHASIRLVPGLELSGWYYDALVGGGDFEPPRHSRISATFYSKFWRVFKSGIFALRAEVAMESWSRWGLGGLAVDSATGTVQQRAMIGSSFVDTNLEMQLAGVTLFWTVQNINVMRSSYVEGLGFPKSAQQYGARWFFTN